MKRTIGGIAALVTGRLRPALLGLAALALVPGTAHAVNPGASSVTVRIAIPPQVSAVKIQTPASPGPGATVTYAIVVTNTGFVTVTNMTVVDTVASTVAVTGSAQPAGFGAPVPGSIGSGTRFVWSATGLSLGLGQSYTFTLTGAVVPTCGPLAVINNAWVSAAAFGATSFLTSNVTSFITSPPVLGVSPSVAEIGGYLAGGTISYRLVVPNTGSATITSIAVTDTVPAEIVSLATLQAAPFGAPATAVIGGKTWYGWSAGPVSLPPGGAYTFTITGQVARVCSPATIADAMFVTAQDGCQTQDTGTSSGGGTIQPHTAAVAVTQIQTPAVGAAVTAGAPISYQITVANQGSATVNALEIVDTLPAALVGVTSDQPAPLSAPIVTSVAGGTRYVWSMLGSLQPGVSLTFTVSGVAGFACAGQIAMGNTAYVTAATPPCAGLVVAANTAAMATITPATPVIAVSNLENAPSWAIGSTVSYVVRVTNTGGTVITGLTVDDTLPAYVIAATTTQPAGFAAPGVVGGASATRFLWSAGGLSFLPGTALTFTVTGQVGAVCAPTPVVPNEGTAIATAPGACASAYATAITSPGPVIAPYTTSIAITNSQTPVSPVSGDLVTYRIVVRNTGTATVTGLTVADTVSPIITLSATSADQPAGWAAPTVLGGPTATGFIWTSPPISMTTGMTYTFTVAGNVGTWGTGTTVTTTAFAGATSSCVFGAPSGIATTAFALAPGVSFAGMFGASPSVVSTGQPILLCLSVTNTGSAPSTTLTPAALIQTGGPVQPGVSGPWPGSWPGLAPGQSIVFTWTITASVAGIGCQWIGAASSAEAATGGFGSQPLVAVQSAASLAVLGVVPSKTGVCNGEQFNVAVTVRNNGTAAATGVSATIWANGPAAWGLPVPATASIAGTGGTATFVWSVTATAAGSLTFSATAAGFDFNSGAQVAAAPVAAGSAVTVAAPALLSATMWFSTAQASVGQNVTVTVTVWNAGGSMANNVAVAHEVVSGTGAPVSGVTAVQNIPVNAGAAFTFPVTVGAAGTLRFSVTAAGTTCGVIAYSTSTTAAGSLAAVSGAAITGTPLVTPTGPAVVGDVRTVTYTVSNSGTASAINVIPAALTFAGGTASQSGWVPPGPVTIAGGGSVTFSTNLTLTNPSSPLLVVQAAASGQDQNTAGTVTTPGQAAPGFLVTPVGDLGVAFDVTAGAPTGGRPISATLFITNIGGTTIFVGSPTDITVTTTDPGAASIGAASAITPARPFTLPNGATQAFAWFYTTAATCGPVNIAGNVWGREAITNRTIGPLAFSRTINVNGQPLTLALNAKATSAEVGHPVPFSVLLTDDCVPALPISGYAVSLSIVAGNGRVTSGTPVTDSKGVLGATLWVGTVAGVNTVRAGVTGGTNPSAVASVTGTVRPEVFDTLTKNFLDPKKGETVQVRAMVPSPVRLTIRVFNLAGELVRLVGDAQVQPGVTVWTWDGRTEAGDFAANGTYFIQIVAGKDTQVKRVIILKR